jgi:Raf kinase inhibitor-like YbhB/YbcL family protein
MRTLIRTLLVALSIGGIVFAMSSTSAAASFQLTSPAFKDGGTLPHSALFNGFGVNGKNESPALSWTGAPAGTKSFALTVFDPDAPTGHGWTHWVAFNIPGDATGLPANAGAAGNTHGITLGSTDFGTSAYGGAAPPPGDPPHRYIFTLYALDVPKLDLDSKTTIALLGFSIRGHVLGQAKLTGLYGR